MAIIITGTMLVEVWEDIIKRQKHREQHQITRLHDWKKRRNGRWVNDVGWCDAHPTKPNWFNSIHFSNNATPIDFDYSGT